jgi:NAD(P)-dependent dehydrogenase (short-subunit alcohol dehydrogenase family)
MARLADKVALITGAGTGIGRATAQLFATEGATVVVAEIDAASGEQTAQLITQAGGTVIALRTDVTDSDSVEAAVARAEQHFGALGIAGRDCYTAAKGGISAITRSMAVEFAAQKVRVNAIDCPFGDNDRS